MKIAWLFAVGAIVFSACAPSPASVAAASGCPANVAWVYPPLPTLNSELWQYGRSHLGQTVGTGECAEVPENALQQYGGATVETLGTTDGRGDYVWGDLVQVVTPVAPRFVNVLPGDVVQYENASFRWMTSPTTWESESAAQHTAIVSAVSADGASACVFQQNSGGNRFVTYGFYQVAGMTSGVLHVYRPRFRTPARR